MKKMHTWIGLVGLAVAIVGCDTGDDDGGSGGTTTNTTMNTTGENTSGDASTGEPTTGDPPATGDGTSSGGADDSSSGGGVTCDPACEPGQECIDGVCFDTGVCDPACDPATEECVDGVCMPLPADSSDYGPCTMECPAGEMPVSITGLDGCFCSPMCDGMNCPPPNEGTAQAMCVLTFEMGQPPSQCALICGSDEDCPTGATCQDAGGGSICMHPAM